MIGRTLLIAGFMVWAAAPDQGQLKQIKGAIGKAVPQTVSSAVTPKLEPFASYFKQY